MAVLSPLPVVTPSSFRTQSSPARPAFLLAGSEHEAVLSRKPRADAARRAASRTYP